MFRRIKWKEDLVDLYAQFLCLVGCRDGACKLALAECLAGLFRVEDVAAAEGPALRLVPVVLLHQARCLAAEARGSFLHDAPYLLLGQLSFEPHEVNKHRSSCASLRIRRHLDTSVP